MQLEGLRERCKLNQRVRAEPGRQTTLVHFWSENALFYLLLNGTRSTDMYTGYIHTFNSKLQIKTIKN